MNLTQLKYFHTVCLLGTVSEGAKALHISQPSLSFSIKELEREFGVELFYRRKWGMEMTPEGEILHRYASDLLERTEKAESVMKELGNGRRTLRLGIPPMIGSLILHRIYGEFLPQNSDLFLEITEGGKKELQQKLSAGELDMIFLPHSSPLDGEFSSIPLGKLEIVCGVSPQNSAAMPKSVTPRDLEETPLVLFENGFFQTERIKGWFAKEGISPKVILQTRQLSTMLRMIKDNLAIGFLFRDLAQSDPEICPISARCPLFVEVSLVWKKDSFSFYGLRKMKEYVTSSNPFLK